MDLENLLDTLPLAEVLRLAAGLSEPRRSTMPPARSEAVTARPSRRAR